MPRLWFARKPRKPIRSKPKVTREFRKGKVILDAEKMGELREAALLRSVGFCENGCGRRVFWETGELHHLTDHGTRTDTLDRVRFICKPCHEKITGTPQWSKRA